MLHSKYSIVAYSLLLSVSTQAQVAFPLKHSSNNRYLIDQNNRPFPILGRTAWFIISLPDTSLNHFIDNTLQHGYNAIEMSVMTHWKTGNHAPFDGNGQIPFLKTVKKDKWNGNLLYRNFRLESPDLLTPNETYWKHVDTLLSYCESKGILVLMFPAYLGYSDEKEDQGWMKELVANGPVKDSIYGAWIARRYKNQKNILWMLLGDRGHFTPEQAAAELGLIRGLKSIPGQLSNQYSAESQSGENASDNLEFGQEMTMNGSYSWDKQIPIAFITRKAYTHQPVIPAFLLEEPYDEEGPDGNDYNPNATQPVRRFQWWGWLNTIGGYVSGNGYIWPFEDRIWQRHLDTQGALDMMRMNAFIQSINWWQLVPSGLNGMDELILNNTPDTNDAYISADASRDGSLFVAYIPPAHSGNVVVNMKPLQKKLFGFWFDPTSATYFPFSKTPIINTKTLVLTPPHKNSRGANDWVLILTNRKKN